MGDAAVAAEPSRSSALATNLQEKEDNDWSRARVSQRREVRAEEESSNASAVRGHTQRCTIRGEELRP